MVKLGFPFSLHNDGTDTSSFFKLKNQITTSHNVSNCLQQVKVILVSVFLNRQIIMKRRIFYNTNEK